MNDETRTELRRDLATLVACAELPGAFVGPAEVQHDQIMANSYRSWALGLCVPFDTPEESLRNPQPLTTAQHLALSVLLGEAPEMALAEYLLDQGHEYAVAVAERARVDGEKAGIEAEKARCLHLLGLGRPYFARGGVVSDTAANELRLAIDGNLKPTPKVFFESSLLR